MFFFPCGWIFIGCLFVLVTRPLRSRCVIQDIKKSIPIDDWLIPTGQF